MKEQAARRLPAAKNDHGPNQSAETESFDSAFARALGRAPFLAAVALAFFLLRTGGFRAGPVLLIVSGIALLPFAFVRPELALYALTLNFVNEFDSYYELQSYFPLSLPILLDLALAAGILLRVALPGRIPRLTYIQNVFLLAYVSLTIVSILSSPVEVPAGYWARFRTGFLIRPVFYLFIVLLVRSSGELHRFLLVFLSAHSLLMLSCLSDYVQKGGAMYRVTGTLSATNYLSYLCIATLPIVVSLYVRFRDRRSKSFMLALSLVTLFVSLQTLSRSGYYALLAILAFLTLRLARTPRTLLVALAFGAVFYTLIPTGLTERLSEVESLSTTSRYYLSRVGLRMVRDHPILGVGLHAYEHEFPKYDYEQIFQKKKSPHNLYIFVAAASGIPALFVYIGIYGTTLYQTWRIQRRYRRLGDFHSLGYGLTVGIQGGLVGHFVFGFAGSYADSYYAFLLLGLAVILVRYHQEHPAPAVLR